MSASIEIVVPPEPPEPPTLGARITVARLPSVVTEPAWVKLTVSPSLSPSLPAPPLDFASPPTLMLKPKLAETVRPLPA